MVDSKLLHLVRKLVGPNRPQGNNGNESVGNIANRLKTLHREYQRKDPTWLIRNVQKALEELGSSNPNNGTSGPQSQSQSQSKKRTLQDLQEDLYEKEAQQSDVVRQEAVQSMSSLNDSLSNRYRQVNQEREKQQEQSKVSETTSGKKKKLKRRKGIDNNGNTTGNNGDSASLSFMVPVERPTERYTDLGGMQETLTQIRQLIEYPLVRPELYRHLGVDPPRGVLLRGPPGCGKTHLANAVAGQLGLPFFRVSAPELVSGVSGDSEGRIRDLFSAASAQAPTLIFMDELDAIAPKRSADSRGGGMEKRMVAQLLTCMDSVAPKHNRNEAAVIVLGATNRPDAMDPALRRAGRFDKEILLGVPDEEAREGILRTMTKTMRLGEGFDFKKLARLTPGYVGADVKSLTKEAAVLAINRIFQDVLGNGAIPAHSESPDDATEKTEATKNADIKNESEAAGTKTDSKSVVPAPTSDTTIGSVMPLTAEQMEPLYVTMDDFLAAIPSVQPSSKREGFATVPDVSWDDIGPHSSNFFTPIPR